MENFVSIYLITHNRIHLLKRAIQSVFSQTHQNFELIIVDDASSDGTETYLNELSLQNEKVRYFRNPENKGPAFSRNRAISEARGEFLTGLDDDDEFTEDRVESFLSAYKKKPGVYYSYYNVVNKRFSYLKKMKKQVDASQILTFNYIGNQIFAKTSVFRKYKGFDVSLPSQEDYEYWIRIVLGEGVAYCVARPSYTIYKDHEAVRVSVSSRVLEGRVRLIKNHKSSMTRSQYLYQMYYLFKARHYRQMRGLFCMVPFSQKFHEFKLFVWETIKKIVRKRR